MASVAASELQRPLRSPAAVAPQPQVPVPQRQAWRAFLSAHAAVVTHVESALAQAELPPLGWYDVLHALREAPEGRLRPRDLGLHLTISKSGLTRLVDRIAAAGLIERRECPTDRRGHLIAITEAGLAMLRRMSPIYEGALTASFGQELSVPEAESLRALCERLTTAACESARGA